MKRSTTWLVGIVAILIILIGGYGIFHKSPAKTITSKQTSSSNTNSNLEVNNSVLITKTSSALGYYLAEPNGDALYTYDGDTTGVTNVTGSLLASWPAYQDTGATTGLPTSVGTIKRTDNGELQYTYNGLPLYTFVADSSGQVTGNGVSNFTIARPESTSQTSSATHSSVDNSTPSSDNSASGY